MSWLSFLRRAPTRPRPYRGPVRGRGPERQRDKFVSPVAMLPAVPPRHAPAREAAHKGNLRSIVAMLLAVAFFSLMDVLLKLLSQSYPAMQVAALRGLTAMPLVLLYVLWRGAAGTLLRVRWPLHLLRGALSIGMLFLFTYGVRHLPLSNAYTLFFVAPLLITALSIPFLGERVPRLHWLAIAVGLLGVLVALRPSAAGFFSWGGLAVLGAATCYAASAIAGRLLSRTDSSESMVFWVMTLLTLGAGALALPQWVAIDPAHGWWLLGLALTGFGGQVAITEAFRHGQASAVAPFEYSALAWAIALDWLIWTVLPDGYTLAGAAVIVASGLFLLRREKNQAA